MINRLRIILDRSLNVANALDKAVNVLPDRPLFFFQPEIYLPGVGASVTPAQLRVAVDRIGNVLRGGGGLQRYERVAIWKANAGDYFLAGLATMRAGGIAVPINGGMPVNSLEQYLDYTGTRILVTDVAGWARVRQAGTTLRNLRRVLLVDGVDPQDSRVINLVQAMRNADDTLVPAQLACDDDVLLVHTSGTTGFPKAVIHTSGTLVAGIKGQLKIEPIFRSDVALSASPFNHFINYLGLLSALVGGVRTWLAAGGNPQELLDLIDRERISVVFCFPHTYLAMYQLGLGEHDLSSVRLWLSGADACHEAHVRPFVERGAFLRLFGRRIVNAVFVDTLGSSEVGFAALFRFTPSWSKRFQRFAGKPTFAGPKLKIADAEGRPLPDGQVGRFMVKGPTLFKGYWNAHDRLHGVVREGWWATGDVGFRDTAGRFYHLDREVDVIHAKYGPVYTLPIEEMILKHTGVSEAVVFGRALETGGEEPFAVVEPMPGHMIPEASLLDWINGQLEPRQKIAGLRVVETGDIPRGLTGKVLKRVLRERWSAVLTAEVRSAPAA